jgi:hypothetical protein
MTTRVVDRLQSQGPGVCGCAKSIVSSSGCLFVGGGWGV